MILYVSQIKSKNFSKLRHAQCKTFTHIIPIWKDEINSKIPENNIKNLRFQFSLHSSYSIWMKKTFLIFQNYQYSQKYENYRNLGRGNKVKYFINLITSTVLYLSKWVNMHEQYLIKEVIHQEILNKRNGNCKWNNSMNILYIFLFVFKFLF